MTQISYKHPPITEAVIEIGFTRPHNNLKIDKFIKKQKGNYADYQKLNQYKVDIDISSQRDEAKTEATPHFVHRFSSEDMTRQLLLNESSFIVSQLAPYCGWTNFIDRFVNDWQFFKKHLGFNEIKHIGVRYINRLDIPVDGPTIAFSEYVNIGPMIPESLGPNSSYAIQVIIPMGELKSMLAINSAVVKSPLLNCMSLVVDQDIVKTDDVPQNDVSIFSYLNEVHEAKNSVFESCITDKARELFNT